MTSEMLEAALTYAAQGLAVFPCKGKQPATEHGCKDASTNEALIRHWWANREYNIGIACGHASSGLVVIDVDVHSEGSDAKLWVREWERQNKALKATRICHTPTGGLHIYYRSDQDFKNSAGGKDLQIDIRGTGGYVIAPPSVHPAGGRYKWDNEEVAIAKATGNEKRFIKDVQGSKQVRFKSSDFEVPDTIAEGQRNDGLFRVCCSYRAKGQGEDELMRNALAFNKSRIIPPLPEAEVRKLVHNVCSIYEQGTGIRALSIPDDDWRKQLNYISKNNVTFLAPTQANYIAIIENDPQLRGHFFYEPRVGRTYIEPGLPSVFNNTAERRPMAEHDEVAAMAYIESIPAPAGSDGLLFGVPVKKQSVRDALDYVAHAHPRNLAVEALDALEWDKVPRVGYMLNRYLGAALCEYTAEVERLMFAGLVARTYEPGCKFDYVPVLTGAQGIGKSQFCRMLCLDESWFLAGIPTMSDRRAIELVQGKAVVELAELASLRGDQLETQKAFITTNIDTDRRAYGHYTEDFYRTCIFIGTTNDDQFLRDKTGNRRWLPVPVGIVEKVGIEGEPRHSLFTPEAKYEFEQAIAEAVHAYKTNPPSLVLRPSMQRKALEMQNAAAVDDTAIGRVCAYLEGEIRVALKRAEGNVYMAAENIYVCTVGIAKEVFEFDNPPSYLTSQYRDYLVHKIPGWEPRKKRLNRQPYGLQTYWKPTEATVQAIKDKGEW